MLENEEFGKRYDVEAPFQLLDLSNSRIFAGVYNFVYDRCDMPTLSFIKFFYGYVDYIIIPWTEILLLDKKALKERISSFKEMVNGVFSAGEILEKAFMKGVELKMIKYLIDSGFDGIGLRESPFVDRARLLKMIELLKKIGVRTFVKMFDVYSENFLERAKEYISMKVDFIIIPLTQSDYPSIGLTHNGEINWDNLIGIVDEIGTSKIIFHVPKKSVVAELFYAFGRYISILVDKFSQIIDVELLRSQIHRSIESISIVLREMKASVSTKFVYFVLASEGPMSIKQLAEITGLPIKTIQYCLKNLRDMGYVQSLIRSGSKREKIWMAILPKLSQ